LRFRIALRCFDQGVAHLIAVQFTKRFAVP
jgi:hypothetical protein